MDRRKPVAIVLALHALFVVPTLCVSGVFAHACAHEWGATECRHEEACASDPCADAVTRRLGPGDLELAWALVAVPAPGFSPRPADQPIPSFAWPIESPPLVNLPFPPSDVPLLI